MSYLLNLINIYSWYPLSFILLLILYFATIRLCYTQVYYEHQAAKLIIIAFSFSKTATNSWFKKLLLLEDEPMKTNLRISEARSRWDTEIPTCIISYVLFVKFETLLSQQTLDITTIIMPYLDYRVKSKTTDDSVSLNFNSRKLLECRCCCKVTTLRNYN